MHKRNLLLVMSCLLACWIPSVHAQQGYPLRPIRIVVPYLPGGSVDFVARIFSGKLSEAWGQQVIVDNRSGGGTNIGAELVARAAPDGYTLFMASAASSVNMTLFSNLSYDILRDFIPVSLLTTSPNILVLHPSLPVKSVSELVSLAKARPGELTYASAGIGSSTHLAGELFKHMAKINLVHVPYRGGGGVLIDLLAGRVAIYFSTIPTVLPHVEAGKLRGIAVTSAVRSKLMPNLPTVAQAGVPGYETQAWNGLMAPAGTSPEIIRRLNEQAVRILGLRDVDEQITARGAEVVGSSPGKFTEFLKQDIERYAPVIRSSGMKPE